MLEHTPLHVRKRLALAITLGIGLVLILVLVVTMLHPTLNPKGQGVRTRLVDFYATLLDNTQSFFGSHRAILKE